MQHQLFSLSHLSKKDLTHLLTLVSFILISTLILTPFQPLSLFNINHFLPKKASKGCDYSHGKWVWDDTQTGRTYSEKCPFLDPGFRCRHNGRKDLDYQKWRWQPHSCNLPRYVFITNCTYFCKIIIKKLVLKSKRDSVIANYNYNYNYNYVFLSLYISFDHCIGSSYHVVSTFGFFVYTLLETMHVLVRVSAFF